MRVATYTQPTAPTRGSILALTILLATIMLGTGVVPTLIAYSGGPLEKALTPLWLLLYMGAFLGLMFTHGINWISWLVRYRILLVLLIVGTMLSVTWSIDMKVSSERTIHLVGSTLIAIYIGFSVPLLTTLRVFAVALAIFMISSVATAVGVPEIGIESYEGTQVWRGVFNSKNDLGFWAAVGVLLYVTLSDSTRRSYLKIGCFMLAGLCLAVLGFSQSATSLLAMLVAGALSLYLFIASRFQLGFIRMVFMAVLFVGVTGLAIANIDTAELVGRTDDLTGRGEVWKQTWKLILERPLTGFGYGSLWFPTDATIWIQQSLTDFTWVVFHAHNGLLQVASEVGMPLAMIALLMVAQQLIEIFYCQYERQQVGVLFVLAFVTVYLISNFSEARFLVTRELFWIFFLALPVSMLRQINLVSVDSAEEEDESEKRESSIRTPAYGSVPGKPWLGPLPHELSAPDAARTASAGVAAGTAVALVPYVPTTAVNGSETFDGLGRREGEESESEFDVSSSTLSLDETDIDLGGLVNGSEADSGLHNETLDLTKSEEGAEMSDTREPLEHGGLRYDDTLDVDRYDKDFDVTGEWLDISLDNEDR